MHLGELFFAGHSHIYPSVKSVLVKHEQGASFMASGCARIGKDFCLYYHFIA